MKTKRMASPQRTEGTEELRALGDALPVEIEAPYFLQYWTSTVIETPVVWSSSQYFGGKLSTVVIFCFFCTWTKEKEMGS